VDDNLSFLFENLVSIGKRSLLKPLPSADKTPFEEVRNALLEKAKVLQTKTRK
jgi:hypothetical protein